MKDRKGRLSEAQRKGLEFLSVSPWEAAWWGGKPHGSWPKKLSLRVYSNLIAKGFIANRHTGAFKHTVCLTPAGRAALREGE